MPKVKVAGRVYNWPDPDSIKLGEGEMVEEQLNVSPMRLIEEGELSEKLVLAMLMIAKQRADGGYDLDQLRDLSMSDIDWIDDEPEPAAEPAAAEVDPPAPAESGSAKSASKNKNDANS